MLFVCQDFLGNFFWYSNSFPDFSLCLAFWCCILFTSFPSNLFFDILFHCLDFYGICIANVPVASQDFSYILLSAMWNLMLPHIFHFLCNFWILFLSSYLFLSGCVFFTGSLWYFFFLAIKSFGHFAGNCPMNI